jgi:hypothetical protein
VNDWDDWSGGPPMPAALKFAGPTGWVTVKAE